MPSFAYQAATADGKLVTGAIDAMDKLGAVGRLQERGLIPISVAVPGESGGKVSAKLSGFFASRGMAKHRQMFARTLASMLQAGVPLDRSLSVSTELCESGLLKSTLQQVLRAVKGGKSLSAGMEAHPKVFPNFYVSMVR